MNKTSKFFYLTSVYLFLYLPIVVVVIYSFNNASRSLVWHGFTLDWYRYLLQDSSLLVVAWHSLIIGILAATIASFMATLAATSLYRYKFYGKRFLHGLLFILIVSPDIVMAISLLMLYSWLQIPLGFWTLLLSHITFCMPFITIIIYSRMTSLNKYIFEAAKDLGANDTVIFRRIIIPLLWPGILSGWLIGFTLSLDDVIISYFVTGPSFQILPLKIYSLVRMGVKPEINALCTLLLVFTLIIVLGSQLMLRKKQ
ncbi:MAG: spermidine/putrescine ABC transporter permease PotC [Gammaproteobacteria bacterium]|nr:spermidine/putrescine ABC transporter permease PotC [Gammaproteobacteria bacterium]